MRLFHKTLTKIRQLVLPFLRAQGAIAIFASLLSATLAILVLGWVMAQELDFRAEERAEKAIVSEVTLVPRGEIPPVTPTLPKLTGQPSELIYVALDADIPEAQSDLGRALTEVRSRLIKPRASQYERIYLDSALRQVGNIWQARWMVIGTSDPFNGQVGMILTLSMIEEQRFISQLKPILWWAAGFVASVTIIAFLVSYFRFVRSTRAIVCYLEHQETNPDLSISPPMGVVPALDRIRDTAMRTFDRLARQRQDVLQVLADMPHDFGNTAARLSARISSAGSNPSPAEIKSALEQAASQFRELSEFQIELFETRVDPKHGDIGAWLGQYLDSDIRDELEDHDITLHLALPVGHQVLFHENSLAAVVDNLLTNACKYTEALGKIVFELYHEEESIFLRVTNSPARAGTLREGAKFGQRWIRSEEVSHLPGTGFGLFRVRKLMEMMRGEARFEMIEPQSKLPRMFEVTLRFSP